MNPSLTIATPANFITIHAMAFCTEAGDAVPVTSATPLPVDSSPRAATSSAVSGSLAASGTSAVFTPQLGRPIWITLSGSWTGKATLERSTDAGATWLAATLGGSALA